MAKNNVDKIILLACLLIASILFYQNQSKYETKLSEKLNEISQANIDRLEFKHFDLRNKLVQFNDADKYGLALSDLFLKLVQEVDKAETLNEAHQAIRSYGAIKLYISESDFYELKSIEDVLNHILNMIEKIVQKERPREQYETKFTILTENHLKNDGEISFTVRPFESYQIPKGELSATLNGETLNIDAAPEAFCLRLENVKFESALGIKNKTESALP